MMSNSLCLLAMSVAVCSSLAAPAAPVLAAPDAAAATNPLWRAPKVKNYLPDMTWPEVQALLSRTDMVIIPVGALEQHGP